MKDVLIGLVLTFLFLVGTASADKVVRDKYGNVVQTWTRQGNTVDVRDNYGNLQNTRRYYKDRIDVRDKYGNHESEEKINR